MPVNAAVTSFNAGELSPKMLSRSDVSQYSKGCRRLENFIVTPYGAVERRPGLKFIAQAKYPGKMVRLIRFVYSRDIAYVCEFGDKYIRFFRNSTPVLSNDGTIFEINSPYLDTELNDIQFIQSADVMTIVHPVHPVMELRRIETSLFTLNEKEYQYPPMLEPNIDDDFTLTPSAREGEITLTASKAAFTEGNIGGFFQIVHTRDKNEIQKYFSADGFTEPLEVFGYWSFTTRGTWSGTVTIQRSFDQGRSWNDFRVYSSSRDQNHATDGNEERENVLYRVKMEDYQPSDTGTLRLCLVQLVNPDFSTNGVVKITGITSPETASATVIRKLGDTAATREWNEGAWSSRRGFPRTIAYFEERMVFGGSDYRPQTIWGSKTGDWDNFLIGDRDDDAIEFTLASDTVNTICWLCQHDALIIGTVDSEWTLSASDSTAALTPSNFTVKRQSVYGSAGIVGQMVGETVLFVQQGARKIREFVFQWEKNGYVSPDMTVLADHITESGVKETALQQLPDSILWCVLKNGTVAALTYEREQEVIGWHKHTTAGEFLSVCTVPLSNEHQVFFAVRRNDVVCIEVMAPRRFGRVENAFFVDSGITVSGNAIAAVSGLDHLEGQTLAVLADGAELLPATVSGGVITLETPANLVTVGLAYSSIASPMPIEIEMQNGSSILRKKSVGTLKVRVYDSVGGQLKCGEGDWQQIISRDIIDDNMDKAITLKSEIVSLNMLSGSDDSIDISVRQNSALPFNMSCLVAVYDVGEK